MDTLPEFICKLLPLPFLTILIGIMISLFFGEKYLKYLNYFRLIEFIIACLLLFRVFSKNCVEISFLKISITSSIQFTFGLRADELSSIILCMISLISACIFRYSGKYLDGDVHKNKFIINYQVTIFFVFLLVMSNNILMFFLAWLGISFGLHKLLLHYFKRPKAKLAAKKKWFISRIGDFCLLVAIFLTFYFFHSFNFSELIEIAKNAHKMNDLSHQNYFSFIGIFIAIGALAKSAQFPFHFWLPETMETPTPVSALMHAGIINAGGFLILRFSPILTQANLAHAILIIFGGISAVLGALVMMTQTDIKKQLAYSTISQLGFMMFQCGIGAYILALFHMISHGFYKAHAFLSAPNVVHLTKTPKRNLSKFGLICSFLISSCLLIISFFINDRYIEHFELIYFSILSLSLTQIIGSRNELSNALFKNTVFTLFYFLLIFSLYFVFNYALFNKFKYIMPSFIHFSVINIVSVFFVFFLFIFGIFIAKNLQNISSNFSKKLFIFFWNGAYFPVLSSKIFSENGDSING